MGNIERYQSGKCGVCGHFTPIVPTGFVSERALTRERAVNRELRDQLRGAVSALGQIEAMTRNLGGDFLRINRVARRALDADTTTSGGQSDG